MVGWVALYGLLCFGVGVIVAQYPARPSWLHRTAWDYVLRRQRRQWRRQWRRWQEP